MKPHDDLMGGLDVSTAPGVSLSLKGELCSHDVPAELKGVLAKENKVKQTLTCQKTDILSFLSFLYTIDS